MSIPAPFPLQHQTVQNLFISLNKESYFFPLICLFYIFCLINMKQRSNTKLAQYTSLPTGVIANPHTAAAGQTSPGEQELYNTCVTCLFQTNLIGGGLTQHD